MKITEQTRRASHRQAKARFDSQELSILDVLLRYGAHDRHEISDALPNFPVTSISRAITMLADHTTTKNGVTYAEPYIVAVDTHRGKYGVTVALYSITPAGRAHLRSAK